MNWKKIGIFVQKVIFTIVYWSMLILSVKGIVDVMKTYGQKYVLKPGSDDLGALFIYLYILALFYLLYIYIKYIKCIGGKNQNNATFQLQDYLQLYSNLPGDSQLALTKTLTVLIKSFLLMQMYSRKLADEAFSFHLQDKRTKWIMQDIGNLKEEIHESEINEKSKACLVNNIDEMITDCLSLNHCRPPSK